MLAAEGIAIGAVRLDSDDLAAHARAVCAILDAAGQHNIRIIASGGLDEAALLEQRAAPIDGFGIGTSLTTSQDAPALDCAYKLLEYASRPRRKQAFRRFGADCTIAEDIVALADEALPGMPLLQPAMRGGRVLQNLPDLATARQHAAASLRRLPPALRDLWPHAVPVIISDRVRALAAHADADAPQS